MSAENASANQAQRVVITGVGAVTPLGQTAETFWKACLAGCSGVTPITGFDASGYSTRIAAEIKEWNPAPYMDKKDARRMATFVQYGVKAACLAVEDAGLQITDDNRDRIGVYIGSGIGGIGIIETQHETLLQKGPDRVSPFIIPGIICDMSAGMVSIVLGARGPNACITTACTTGTNNIGEAYHIVRRGDADVDDRGRSRVEYLTAGNGRFLSGANPVATQRRPRTRQSSLRRESRWFRDGRRQWNSGSGIAGFGAGAGRENLCRDHRVRRVRGRVSYYVPPPDGNGAIRAMQAALKSAGLQPSEVDYINAHGTSTELNDKIESLAIKTVLGEHAYKVPISSTKSMTGHLLGAAGAVEAIICALTIRDGIIHPTINYETPDPNCDLDYVPNQARKADVKVALSNSFGFGGHNGTLIFRRVEA